MDPDPPSDAQGFAKVGDVLLARGETERAIASYHQALALNPQLFETHLSLAAAKARQGKLAEATVSCRNAIALHPNHSGAHHELGCLLAPRETGRCIHQLSEGDCARSQSCRFSQQSRHAAGASRQVG